MPPISVERRRFDSGLAVVSFQNNPVEATRHEVWLIPASPIPVRAVSLRTEVRGRYTTRCCHRPVLRAASRAPIRRRRSDRELQSTRSERSSPVRPGRRRPINFPIGFFDGGRIHESWRTQHTRRSVEPPSDSGQNWRTANRNGGPTAIGRGPNRPSMNRPNRPCGRRGNPTSSGRTACGRPHRTGRHTRRASSRTRSTRWPRWTR